MRKNIRNLFSQQLLSLNKIESHSNFIAEIRCRGRWYKEFNFEDSKNKIERESNLNNFKIKIKNYPKLRRYYFLTFKY